jgi:succinoglycan biosynthesis transport protein ExoP
MDNGKSGRLLEGHGHGKESSGRLAPLQVIWHRRWFVVAVMIVVVIGAGVLAHFLPKVYTSTCRIVIEPAASRTGGDFNMDSYLNTQAELISESAAIHADALRLLQERGHGDLATLTQGSDPSSALDAIQSGLSVVPGKNNDGVLAISFNASSYKDATYIVNAVVDAFTAFTSSDNHKSNGDSIKSIEADKDRWESQMHEQYTKLANLKGDVSKLQADQTVGNAQVQSLAALSQAVAQARIDSINAQSAFEEFAKLNIGDVQKLDTLLNTGQFNNMMVVPAQDGEQIKTDMYNAKQRLEDLKERYLPNHPAVQAAQEKMDDLMASYVLFLHQRWVSSADKLKRLEQNYDTLQKAVADVSAQVTRTLATKTAQLDELEKLLARNENLTGLLAARVQEMKSDDHLGAAKISPLKRPQADDEARPSKPNLPVIVFEAMIVGLFLGMVLALIDPRMRSVEEVVAATDLPILGVIPHMARRLSLQSRGRKVQLDPMSDVSEAYRGIRSAVFFGPKGKTILVTSPMRGEGKSTMSANLAIAMAEAGQRVLLLDGDLREPMQHRIFAISNEAGISSVVSGRSSLERAIVSSGIRGLDLLPCGPIPFNPSETINNQTFADLLNDLARRYDHVVVDSPPVMAVTDARILAAMCDLTLLVVRAEFSNKRAAQDAKDGLLGFGANLVGVVVNDGPRNRQRYGYYGGYGRTRGQEGGPKNPAERPSTANPDLAFIPKR